jgi:hypothetical protein
MDNEGEPLRAKPKLIIAPKSLVEYAIRKRLATKIVLEKKKPTRIKLEKP